jgi:hypothetical protein
MYSMLNLQIYLATFTSTFLAVVLQKIINSKCKLNALDEVNKRIQRQGTAEKVHQPKIC